MFDEEFDKEFDKSLTGAWPPAGGFEEEVGNEQLANATSNSIDEALTYGDYQNQRFFSYVMCLMWFNIILV